MGEINKEYNCCDIPPQESRTCSAHVWVSASYGLAMFVLVWVNKQWQQVISVKWHFQSCLRRLLRGRNNVARISDQRCPKGKAALCPRPVKNGPLGVAWVKGITAAVAQHFQGNRVIYQLWCESWGRVCKLFEQCQRADIHEQESPPQWEVECSREVKWIESAQTILMEKVSLHNFWKTAHSQDLLFAELLMDLSLVQIDMGALKGDLKIIWEVSQQVWTY